MSAVDRSEQTSRNSSSKLLSVSSMIVYLVQLACIISSSPIPLKSVKFLFIMKRYGLDYLRKSSIVTNVLLTSGVEGLKDALPFRK